MSSTDIVSDLPVPISPARMAIAPFDDPHADVVLRSCDNVDFFVYRVVLRLASPFFRRMFSLTQPSDISAPDVDATIMSPSGSWIPLVPFTEDSVTIEYLLRLCYPVADPTASQDLPTVAKYLEAALKYELEEATALLTASLKTFVRDQPLQTYAVACRLRLEDTAGAAAHKWRMRCQRKSPAPSLAEQPAFPGTAVEYELVEAAPQEDTHAVPSLAEITGVSYVEEMKTISAGCYYRLIQFLRTGEAVKFCDATTASSQSTSGLESAGAHSLDEAPPPDIIPPIIPSLLFSRCPADIAMKCANDVVVRAHRTVLQLVSGDAITRKIKGEELYDGLPVVEMDEDSITVTQLLRLCYPFVEVASSDLSLEQHYRVWLAAQKYLMDDVATIARKHVQSHLMTSPLRAYFVCLQAGWLSEAKQAALEYVSLRDSASRWHYLPEMELSSAAALHQLLQLQQEYLQLMTEIALKHAGPDDKDFVQSFVTQHVPSFKFPMIASLLVRRVLVNAQKCSENQHSALMQRTRGMKGKRYGDASSSNTDSSYSTLQYGLAVDINSLVEEGERLADDSHNALCQLHASIEHLEQV